MNDSTREYEDALIDILVGALQVIWKDFEGYTQAIAPSRAELIRVMTELFLFPLAYSTWSALAANNFKLQTGLVIAGDIYLRGLADENKTVDLCDGVLSTTEREEYQNEIRRNWSPEDNDLSKASYRVLLYLMKANAATRCGDDMMRATRLNPFVDRKETVIGVFRAWGETLTKRALASGTANSFRYQKSISLSAAMLGGAYFYLIDRLPR